MITPFSGSHRGPPRARERAFAGDLHLACRLSPHLRPCRRSPRTWLQPCLLLSPRAAWQILNSRIHESWIRSVCRRIWQVALQRRMPDVGGFRENWSTHLHATWYSSKIYIKSKSRHPGRSIVYGESCWIQYGCLYSNFLFVNILQHASSYSIRK